MKSFIFYILLKIIYISEGSVLNEYMFISDIQNFEIYQNYWKFPVSSTTDTLLYR